MVAVYIFFNDTATTEIYTLSLHDALPILRPRQPRLGRVVQHGGADARVAVGGDGHADAAAADQHAEPRPSALHRGGDLRSEEHTSELQSRQYLVCRLLLEKKLKLPQIAIT